MGFLQMLIRILGCKNKEDEESQRPIYPQTTLHHRNGDSERLPKISIFHRLICRVLQKIRFVFQRLSPKKTADPILPIQNPAPTTDVNDPSLLQNPLISSPSSNDSDTDEQELHPGNFRISVEDIAQQNVDNFVEEEEKVMIKSINVDEGKWIKHYSSRHRIEEKVEQEEQEQEEVMATRNVVVHVEEEGGVGDKWIKHYSNRYWIEQEEEDKWIEHYSSRHWIEEEEEEEEEEQEEEEEEEKGEVMTKRIHVVHIDEGKWIKDYSSRHRILLVGDGDFSFSASLAIAFGCASNMIATSLDSEVFLKLHYRNARSNIVELRNRSCKVMHEIDATKMSNHEFLGGIKFDRIIFNFPFAGFFKNMSRDSQLRVHKQLVSLFLDNAKEMISENGEIHITHKTNAFHREWNLESLASSHRLYLIESVKFNHRDYPGYSTKCGFGGNQHFNCNPSKTYKFGHKRGVRS